MMIKMKTNGGVIRAEEFKDARYPAIRVFVDGEHAVTVEWNEDDEKFEVHQYINTHHKKKK
jgi:hypothetical protein